MTAAARVASTWDALMRGLGYDSYAAHGSDMGANVSRELAILKVKTTPETRAQIFQLAPIPFGAPTDFFGLLPEKIALQVSDVNVAVLVIFAVASMGVYGIVLAGWASNSKYSLLGGLRSAAQMISYELSYATALASVVMLAGSLSLNAIGKRLGVSAQSVMRWGICQEFRVWAGG